MKKSRESMGILHNHFYESIARARRVAQPTGEPWSFRQYRAVSIFLSLPLARAGVAANNITVAWGVLGLLGTFGLGYSTYWVRLGGACLLILSELLDFVDGEVARLNGQTSASGVFLDLICHDVVKRSLFLPLGFGLFRETANPLYLFMAFSASVFVSDYQIAPFFAEYAGLKSSVNNQQAISRNRSRLLLRKLVTPLFLSMREVRVFILMGAVIDRLAWVILFYAIAGPLLFLWRTYRLSLRLMRD